MKLNRPVRPTPDIFGATETEIEADNKRWDELFSKGRDKMRAMAFEALDEIRAGETEPIFDENGGKNELYRTTKFA